MFISEENRKLLNRDDRIRATDTVVMGRIYKLFEELTSEIRAPYFNLMWWELDEDLEAEYEAEYLASMAKLESVLKDLLMAEISKRAK